MSEQVRIAMRDETSARIWLEKMYLLNEEYRVIMRDTGTALTDVLYGAEGPLADHIAGLGGRILLAGTRTLESLEAISETVLKTIEKADGFRTDAVDLIDRTKAVLG